MLVLDYRDILKMLQRPWTSIGGHRYLVACSICRLVHLHAIISLSKHPLSKHVLGYVASFFPDDLGYEVFITTAEKSSPTPHNSINRFTSPISPLWLYCPYLGT